MLSLNMCMSTYIRVSTYEGNFWENMLNIDGIKEEILIMLLNIKNQIFRSSALKQFSVVVYYS